MTGVQKLEMSAQVSSAIRINSVHLGAVRHMSLARTLASSASRTECMLTRDAEEIQMTAAVAVATMATHLLTAAKRGVAMRATTAIMATVVEEAQVTEIPMEA